MINIGMKNTKNKGVLHFLVYREPSSKEYTGVCLELGLVEVSENPDFLKQSLIDAARGYVHTIIKENLSDELLNVKPSKEYVELYMNALNSLSIDKKTEKSKQTLNDIFVFTKPIKDSRLAMA